MESQIRCKVFPGQFSNEYAVKAEEIGGESFSLFAPIQAVETDENPTRDKAVDGWLKVTIWEQTGDKVIVKLPRESFESGRFVTMSVTQLKTRPEPLKASR
ncbi:MAG TPA: hypothetical protein VMG10_01005 [Gemmataceae bacterium]|nr:hypothetical protein [Gemmataceae bacterium]